MTAPALVPVHPEPVAGDDRALRWVVPAGTLGFVGKVAGLPAVLQALRDDGTLDRVEVEPAAVLVRLSGATAGWRAQGGRVRAALQQALAEPAAWLPATAGTADDVLAMAVRQVIDGEVGDYVRSHGGEVALREVSDGAVVVRLSGACAHCPASDLTLTERFETAVRARFPAVRSVTAQPDDDDGRRWLSLLPLRRRQG